MNHFKIEVIGRRASGTISSQYGILLFAILFCSELAHAQTKNLVTIEKGDLPIILSAPHGGRSKIPGVSEREGEGVRSFKTSSDLNTDHLAEKLSDAIEAKTGKRPYMVIARFHRKYTDANRSPKNAYEDENAKIVYDTYHQAIAESRRDIIKRWGSGILLDLHGQSSVPDKIVRGTQNGRTVKHLTNQHGLKALYGEKSLFGQIAKQGYIVLPEVDSLDQEHENFDGGYITVTYGSHPGEPFDAIQIEIGREMRVPWKNQKTAGKLATALIAFANEYLPVKEIVAN